MTCGQKQQESGRTLRRGALGPAPLNANPRRLLATPPMKNLRKRQPIVRCREATGSLCSGDMNNLGAGFVLPFNPGSLELSQTQLCDEGKPDRCSTTAAQPHHQDCIARVCTIMACD